MGKTVEDSGTGGGGNITRWRYRQWQWVVEAEQGGGSGTRRRPEQAAGWGKRSQSYKRRQAIVCTMTGRIWGKATIYADVKVSPEEIFGSTLCKGFYTTSSNYYRNAQLFNIFKNTVQ